jgi:hypothetical protein
VLCFHCGEPGHTRAECHSRQRGLEARNKVNKRSTKDSMGEANPALAQHGVSAGDRDLFLLPNTTHSTALTSLTASSPMWVVDSGASHNMCNNRSFFISYKRLPSPITIKLGYDTTVTATYHGLAHITQDLQLDALYTPTFRLSLLSISQLEHARYTTTFQRGKCFISADTSSTASITANRVGDLYILQSLYALASEAISTDAKVAFQSKATTFSRKDGKRKKQLQTTKTTSDLTPAFTIAAGLWHQRLAHHNNRVAERKIRSITERARALILDSQAPLEFWGEAINTAAYLHQHMPNEGLTRRDDHDGYKTPYDTPYEMLHSYARSKACMMVGYVHDSMILWRIWDPEHNTVKA